MLLDEMVLDDIAVEEPMIMVVSSQAFDIPWLFRIRYRLRTITPMLFLILDSGGDEKYTFH